MREQTLAVQRMQDYIEQNKTMEITLSDLAKECSLDFLCLFNAKNRRKPFRLPPDERSD